MKESVIRITTNDFASSNFDMGKRFEWLHNVCLRIALHTALLQLRENIGGMYYLDVSCSDQELFILVVNISRDQLAAFGIILLWTRGCEE